MQHPFLHIIIALFSADNRKTNAPISMTLDLKKTAALNDIKAFHALNEDQISKLESFVAILLKENQQFNFIGKSTIDDIWNRHILDSAQLLRFIDNKNAKFADFGTGAGFPGVVLSILGIKEMHLIEKAFRKCDFLRRAKASSANKIVVHQAKLEELTDITFDCITSRALAPLDKLLTHSKKFLKDDGYCLFLKGKNLSNELELAKKQFNFIYETHPSLTSSESNIIKLSQITKK